jgi:hypothetical protein
MKLRPSIAHIIVAGSATVLLAACGTSAAKTGAPPTTGTPGTSIPSTTSATSVAATTTTVASTANFNSCLVVTQAEAASAIGQSVSAGILGNATVEGGLACVFYGPSAPATRTPNVSQTDTVRVVVVKGSNALKWYNDYKGKVPASAVTGYGTQAYFDGCCSLSVLAADGSYLRIAVAPPDAAPSLSDEKQLAAAVLPKL